MNKTVAEYAHEMRDMKVEVGKFDCARMVVKFLDHVIKVPRVCEGFTINTYYILYMKDPEKARGLMVRWLESFLVEIDYTEMKPGDIAVLSYNFSPIFLGIIAGNGKVLVVDRHGVVSAFIGFYKIERMFRCQQLFHTLQPQE